MTTLTKSTVHMLCAKAETVRKEIPIEVQKLLDLYNDPNVSSEDKAEVRKKLDEFISRLENRVETSRLLREQRA